jgi:uncharacterized protein
VLRVHRVFAADLNRNRVQIEAAYTAPRVLVSIGGTTPVSVGVAVIEESVSLTLANPEPWPIKVRLYGTRASMIRRFAGHISCNHRRIGAHERAINPSHASDLSMAVGSPCIGVCKFDGKTGFCVGCTRTKVECRQWKKLKDKTRTKIIGKSVKREAKLKKARR